MNPSIEIATLQQIGRNFTEFDDRPAIISLQESGRDVWSYTDLHKSAQNAAETLRGAGVQPAARVAIHAGNSAGWVSSFFGILEIGATAVPLDAQLSGDALRFVLDDADLSAVITTPDLVPKFTEDLQRDDETLLILDPKTGKLDARGAKRGDSPPSRYDATPESAAILFYTSGTTGRAKGVPLSHANLAFEVNALVSAGLARQKDRLLLPLPLHHVYPCALGIMVPLALGLPLIFPASLTGPQLSRAVKEEGVTVMVGVPRLYRAFYEGITNRVKQGSKLRQLLFQIMFSASGFLRRRLHIRMGKTLLKPVHRQIGSQLRLLASGGSALDPDLAWNLEALGWEIAVGYGLTETAPLLTLLRSDAHDFSSVGRPIPRVEVRVEVSDAAPQETSSTAAPGEVLARGPNVFNGYRNRAEESEKVLTPDGWFHTGDLGFMDNRGYLHLTGRASTLIVTEAGKNVQPEDVEEVYQKHPAIAEVGVLSRKNQIVAVIIPDVGELRQQAGVSVDDAVRNAVREQSQKLPSYQRLSDFVVDRQALERTRLGKIRRHLLEERYDNMKAGKRAADGSPVSAGPAAIEDLSPDDQKLLEHPAARSVWDMLTRRFTDINLTPDTSPQLDLGIDSLEWVSLTFEIRHQAGVELNEQMIADIDTVRDLLNATVDAAGTGVQVEPASLRENPLSLLPEDQKHWVRPLSAGGRAGAAALYGFDWVMMKTLFRVQVRHAEHLETKGQFIITPNHASYLDPFALAVALGLGRLRGIFWAGLVQAAFNSSFKRGVSRLAQAIPVDPGRAAVSSLASAAAVLKDGHSLVWFPEGGRSPTGELQPFKPGIGILLQHFKVPVLPVHIKGSFNAMPLGRMIPRPHRITLEFGPPVSVDELAEAAKLDEAPRAIAKLLHDRVEALGKSSSADK